MAAAQEVFHYADTIRGAMVPVFVSAYECDHRMGGIEMIGAFYPGELPPDFICNHCGDLLSFKRAQYILSLENETNND